MADEKYVDPVQDELDKEGASDLSQIDGPIEFAVPEEMQGDANAASEYAAGAEKQAVDKLMGDFIQRESWRKQYELLWWQIYLLFM